MASAEKMITQLTELKHKLRAKGVEANSLKRHSGSIPGPALPVVAAIAGGAAAWMDGRYGTPSNQHPGSLIGTGVAWAGSFVAAFTGRPTLSEGLAAAASGPIGFLSGVKMYDAGAAAAARAATPPPAQKAAA